MNSSVPSVKRLAASICQTKRKGKRCGRASAAAGLGAVGGAWTAATIAGAAAAAGFAAAGCWPVAVTASSSVKALPAPSLSKVTGPAAMSPLASPLSIASRASLSAPSAIRSRPLPKRSLRRGRHLDQLAVGGKDRRRPLDIGQQAVRALGQAQVLAGAFGRNDQHAGRIVGERDARAEADERAAETGAETAQAFEPRRAALRQRAGQPRDLRGGRMARLEWNRGCARRRDRLENRGRGRVGPEDARSRPRSIAIPATDSGRAPRAADRSGR